MQEHIFIRFVVTLIEPGIVPHHHFDVECFHVCLTHRLGEFAEAMSALEFMTFLAFG